MNQIERQQIGEMWLALANMYGKEISKLSLKLMLDAVADLPAQDVLKALNDWPKTSKRREYPLPFDIRESLAPQVSPEAKGRELLGRLQEAVRKFGYNASVEEVNAFVGSAGEQVIRERGGWHSLCTEQDIFDPAIASQIRERAKDLSIHGEELREFDKLEAPQEKNQLEHKDSKTFLLDFTSKIKTVPSTPPKEGA